MKWILLKTLWHEDQTEILGAYGPFGTLEECLEKAKILGEACSRVPSFTFEFTPILLGGSGGPVHTSSIEHDDGSLEMLFPWPSCGTADSQGYCAKPSAAEEVPAASTRPPLNLWSLLDEDDDD